MWQLITRHNSTKPLPRVAKIVPGQAMDDVRLAELFPTQQILPDLKARTKDEALREIATKLAGVLNTDLEMPIHDALLHREQLASTGIGEQVAIPHGKLDELPHIVGALARSRKGIDFGAIDGRPTHLFFAILAPGSANGVHLKALARIARCCKDETFRSRLLGAQQSTEMHTVLTDRDAR